MNRNKLKKYTIITISIILIIFGIKVGYCCTYVGDILCTYPWDEFTVCEKIASTIKGYDKNPTKQEMYDQGLISKDQTIFKKFNDSHYNKK